MTPTDREVCEAFGIAPECSERSSATDGEWVHRFPPVTTDPTAWCLVEDEIERRGLALAYVTALGNSLHLRDPYEWEKLDVWRLLRATCAERCAAALKCLEE